MYTFEVSALAILTFVAGALALFFDWFPWVSGEFDKLSKEQKRLINLGLVVLVGAIVFLGDCQGWFLTNLECSVKGAIDFFVALFLAASANQGVHSLFKPFKRTIDFRSDGSIEETVGEPQG